MKKKPELHEVGSLRHTVACLIQTRSMSYQASVLDQRLSIVISMCLVKNMRAYITTLHSDVYRKGDTVRNTQKLWLSPTRSHSGTCQ